MMSDGTQFKQRDIVLVSFPYTDFSSAKKRPAVIISRSHFNVTHADVICCAITSNPKEYGSSINLSNQDLVVGAIRFDSRIKPTKLFTLSQGNILRKIAIISNEKCREILAVLNDAIILEE